jgi:ribonuclease HI
MSYYAVANGRNIGIFLTWDECNASVKGFKGAVYKKFSTQSEAEQYLQTHTRSPKVDETATETDTKETAIDYYVYTDGACSNNGRKTAKAGIGIYFGMEDARNRSKKIEGKQTNNTAELTAIIETYGLIASDLENGKKVGIVSDSEYAIRCVTTYGEKCFQKGWQQEIPNKELVKMAYEIYKNVENVQFIHIRAHTNNSDAHSVGNDHADRLANQAIGLENCPYQKP